jgi:hypothetical protein
VKKEIYCPLLIRDKTQSKKVSVRAKTAAKTAKAAQ